MIEQRSGLWPWAVAAILSVGIGARLVQLAADSFGYDAYALMQGVDGPFAEYVKGGAYLVAIRLYYWLTSRIIGGELWCYMLPAAVVAVFALGVVRDGLARQWPERFELHAVVLGLLAFASHSLFLARYPSISYGVSFLVGCWVLFLFMRLAERDFTGREMVAYAFAFVPVAAFSNVTVVVPICCGGLTAFVMRLATHPQDRTPYAVFRMLLSMTPFLVFFAVQYALWVAFPFTNLGSEARPDMRGYFFATSGFSDGGIIGAVKFVIHGGLIIILQAFRQSVTGGMTMGGNLFVLKLVAGVCGACTLAVAASRWRQGALSVRARFVWLYVAVFFAAIAFGGLAGLFPYGNLRYSDGLMLPLFIILATTFSPIQRIQPEVSRSVAAVVCVAMATLGLFLIYQNYEMLVDERKANRSVLTVVERSGIRPLFYAAQQRPVLARRASSLVREGVPLGWGARYGEDVRAEARDIILSQPKQIVMILPARRTLADAFGGYASLLKEGGYTLAKYKAAPALWAGLFERREEAAARPVISEDDAVPEAP